MTGCVRQRRSVDLGVGRRTERASMSPAGIDLRKPGEFTGNLPSQSQPPRTDEQMVTLGSINEKLGKNTLHSVRIPVNAA